MAANMRELDRLGGEAIGVELDQLGILTLTFDMPGRSANVLNDEFTNPFVALLARIEEDDAIKAVILTSTKKNFMVGADIDTLFTITDPAEAMALSRNFQAILRRLETCGKPLVAALNGSALGGGLELALACHYRVAVDVPGAVIGLPEAKIGLLPAGGGTQRLPRLIGIQKALPLLTEGKHLRPDAALKQGVIHATATDLGDMLAQARKWIEGMLE
ncbi:MAG: enoyl-CoA hydratase-related protein, partial [Salinisphaera sp.]|nr:enoyl-CoA hydratase-related protein [Salinisphaera sp.]